MASSAGTMPNTGRWGWYKDHEGREYRRVTTLIKKVETDTYALEEWKKRQVLLGAARRNDLVLAVKALGDVPITGWSQQQKKQIGQWAEECMTAAGSDEGRNLGIAVHDLTERLDRGEDVESVVRGLPDSAAADLRAYAKLRELNGWKSVEIERTVVCDDLPGIDSVGGSFDRIDIIPMLLNLLGAARCQHGHQHLEGEDIPVIVDVKTEGNPLLNGLHIGPQLAIYSRAKRMWLPGAANGAGNSIQGRYVPTPCVRQDVGVIVHVRDGKAIPYFVDLTSGWEAATAAAVQLKREQASKKWFAPVPGIVEPKPAEILTAVAVAGQYASPDRPASPSGSLATAMLDASKMTATVLGPAPMPPEGYKVGDMVTVGGIEFTKHAEMPTIEQVAVTRPDGLVEFKTLDDVDQGAINVASIAVSVEELAALYETYTGPKVGRTWGGLVAEAAEARRKVIECPQAALHTGAGKCACGWTS